MSFIAFIGLGNMGLPMAKNLLAAKYQVRAFDLAQAALDSFSAAGGEVCHSAKEAVAGAEVVISMLPAGKHVAGLYLEQQQLLSDLGPSTLVIDSSTIDAETARRVQQAAKERGIQMIDAPVSGGVAAATAGTLTFMCGGEPEAVERAQEVLSAMGKNIFHAGPSGSGQVAKMCNNMLLAIHMIGTSEALKLGSKNGLDAGILSEIMKASSGRNWSLEVYNPFPGVMENSPASNGYQPGFMVDLMTKDLGLAIDNAEAVSQRVPMGKQALALYQTKQAQGDGEKDFSSIIENI